MLVIGVLAAFLMAAGLPWVIDWFGQGGKAPVVVGGYLPVLPILTCLLLAAVWNPLVRMARLGALALRPWELMAVTALLLATAGITGGGLQGPFRTMILAKPALEGSSASRPLAHAIPDRLSVPFRADDNRVAPLVDGLKDGGNRLTATTTVHDGDGTVRRDDLPARPLLRPLLWGGALVGCGILLILGLAAMTARQWTHHERLQHPLAQVPLALAEGSLLRDNAFRVGFGLVVIFWLWNLGVGWGWNRLPRIATDFTIPDLYRLLGMDSAPGWPRQMMAEYWGSVRIYPLAIGIAFLITLDLGFSVWGGFWLGVVIFGWLYQAGLPVSFPDHGRLVGSGATLGMAALILAMGRHHYWRLLVAAIGARHGEADQVGVWGVRVIIGACLGIWALVWHLGGGTGAAAAGGFLALVLVTAYVLVIARVVAESGLANFQSAETMTLVAHSLGLPILLPYQALVAMLYLGNTLAMDTRENLSGYAVQGAAIGERQGLRPGRVLFGVGLVVLVGAGLAMVSGLASAWVQGAGSPKPNQLAVGKIIALVGQAGNHPDGPIALWRSQILANPVLIGIGLIGLIALARRFWVGFPFNPIGLVVASSWPVFMLWGSLMLGWLAKLLVMRYGGVQLYKQLKPLAIGVILGDIAGYGIQFVAFAAGKAWSGQPLEIWRNMP